MTGVRCSRPWDGGDFAILLVGGARAVFQTGPDLAGGRPGAQPNYGTISVTGPSLGAHKTRGSRP